MPTTRPYQEIFIDRLRRDPEFKKCLLEEAVEGFLSGDVGGGKAALRTYINGTIGFAELGRVTGKSPKSLMRMLSPSGNPQANNIFEIINEVQRLEGVRLEVNAARRPTSASTALSNAT